MRTPRTFFVLVAGLSAMLLAIPAHAVSNRIFLSTNGNNANDCANPVTPCLTFAGALAQVNAGGEVIAEATGGYGPLSITQAVTISGPPGVVIYSGLEVDINAPGATVVLRGLPLDGTGAVGRGISVTAVDTLFVENCVITGFTGTGANGRGIFFTSAGNLFVRDTVIRKVSSAALQISPVTGTTAASIEHCRLDASEDGLVVDPGTRVTVRNTVASGNSGSGFFAENGPVLELDSCVASNNGTGITASGTGTLVRVSNTTITNNGGGVEVIGPATALSRGNNTLDDNTSDTGAFTGTYPAN